MKRYHTLNSTYEVEGERIRRVEGENESHLGVPDGEWIDIVATTEIKAFGHGVIVLAVQTKAGKGFVTSRVLSVEEVEPEPCQFIIRQGSHFEPTEECPEDAEPGSDFCPAHREPE